MVAYASNPVLEGCRTGGREGRTDGQTVGREEEKKKEEERRK